MHERPVFSDELNRLLTKTGVPRARLIDAAPGTLKKGTMSRWLAGESARANNPDAIAAIGDTLGLNRVETNRLARAAGLDSVEQLLATPGIDPRRTARWNVIYRNNLPTPVPRFIGREEAVLEISERLGVWDDRLVTVYGPGGSGKTRLAIEVAMRLRDAFPDGLFMVRLAEVSDPEAVLPAIVNTLGIIGSAGSTPDERLADHLRERRMLLVLDNFEHVLDARMGIGDMLRAAPHVQVLVTSREPLDLAGEVRRRLDPMRLPEPDATPRSALESEAVALFQERAQAVQPRFGVTRTNVTDVVRLCRHLDGLPLAIELVAVRIDNGAAALLEGFNAALVLDTRGPADTDPRLATLRDAINWSYRLLEPGDALLIERLSVFAGGWTLTDAAAVCALPEADVCAALARLERGSLVIQSDDDAHPRYTMLETIREFARERLEARCESETIRRRHAEHFYSLVANTGPYYPQTTQGPWMDRIEGERPNLDAALTWATAHDPAFTLRLATALWPFWHEYEHALDGMRWLPSAVAAAPDAPPELRARALTGLAFLQHSLGSYADAIRSGDEAVLLWRTLGSNAGLGLALLSSGVPRLYSGDVAGVGQAYPAALAALQEHGDPRGIGSALNYSAAALMLSGKADEAEAVFNQVDAIWEALDDDIGKIRTALDRGIAAILLGRYQRAVRLLSQIVDQKPRVHMAGITTATELSLGIAQFRVDKLEDAAVMEARAARTYWEIGDLGNLSLTILAFAAIAIRHALCEPAGSATRASYAERAAVLAGAGAALQANINSQIPAAREIQEEELAKVVHELGQDAFQRAFGFGMTLGPAQAYAMVVNTYVSQ